MKGLLFFNSNISDYEISTFVAECSRQEIGADFPPLQLFTALKLVYESGMQLI